MIVDRNFFVEKVLPMMTLRKLTADEMDRYREPLRAPESPRPIQMWPREIPFDGDPPDVHARLQEASDRLRRSDVPKLLLWVKPGVINRKKDVDWFRREVSNLEDVHLGKGRHFIQEDHAQAIGETVADWVSRIRNPPS